MKPCILLFKKDMLLKTDVSTKKEVVAAIALKKGNQFFAKHLPENIQDFAKTEMTQSGCVMITVLIDILLTVIGLDNNMRKCDRIIFARADREKEGIKGIGFAIGNKCQASYNGRANEKNKLYVYGGAQCMILYKDERAIASDSFAPFGCIVRKTRNPAIRLPYIGIRNLIGQQLSMS